MNVIIFGATGMVGQGVLRESLADADVAHVTTIGRSATGQRHPKLTELVHGNLAELTPIAEQLAGFDACFFCLGVSAAGLSEAEYRRLTFDLTLGAAKTLVETNPAMTFVYVSGAGTDSSEKGRVMWARVKGATENALLAMPFKGAYMFRPGIIQPLDGITSRTPAYRLLYKVFTPLFPLLRAVAPQVVTDTKTVGRAMLRVAKTGAAMQLVEQRDINALGR
jgi:uncharacterized protein YbjT (DUF2867 family)